MRTTNLITRGGLLILFVFWACSKDSTEPQGPTYSELISQGWSAFKQGQYQNANQKFSEAKTRYGSRPEAFTGLGWGFFKLDDLMQADLEFGSGSTKNNPSLDLYAGWAFVLNAQKNYSTSNIQADQVFTQNPNWSFSYGLPLDANDLHVLKAQNYFLLGNFAESLAEVQLLNPAFTANILTDEGKAALAEEIERLTGL